MSEETGVRLSPEEFALAFPFHVAFGSDLAVRQWGRSLSLLCPRMAVGTRVSEHVHLKYPVVPFTYDNVCRHAASLFILETSDGIRLRGQMLVQPETEQVVFLGSPWLTEVGEIRRARLTARDFALHDPVIDLLQVMYSGLSALDETRRLADELTRERAALRKANDELARFSLATSKTNNGILITDASGVVEWVNPGFERLTGYSAAEIVGARPGPLLQGAGTDPATRARIREKLRRGEAFSEEILNYRRDGSAVWISLDVTPIFDDDGRLVRFIGLESDITERRGAQESLTKSTTLLTTLVQNLQAGILVEDQDRNIVLVNPAFCSVLGLPLTPEALRGRDLEELIAHHRILESPEGFKQRLDAILGDPVVVTSEELVLRDGRVLERDFVPLFLRGERFGQLWVYRDVTAQRAKERALQEARQQEAEIGFEIQQALLLGRLPNDLPGLQLDAFSFPSQTIAGDFYDFFRQGPRCLDVVIGDVMGKGIPAALVAAAIKSQFLEAVTELVLESKGVPPEPGRIVQRVHDALTPHLVSLESFATLVYARFDLEHGQLTYVDCGHERTVLLRAGNASCQTLEGSNVPLGFCPDEIYVETRVPLAEGDVLVFYSDGITEARSPESVLFGRERLEQVLTREQEKSPQHLLGNLLREVTSFAGTSQFGDDLTCIAVRMGDPVPAAATIDPILRLDVGSSYAHLGTLRFFVDNLCRRIAAPPFDDSDIERLQLAVVEVATNIIRHAYAGRDDGTLEIEGEVEAQRVILRLFDYGQPFAPPPVEEPDLLERHEGGLGLFLIMQSVDEVTYSRGADGRNCVTLEKYRHSRKE